ncbi:hypothetical protein F5146DRAFT_1222129, partial [Armillaria mellea]
MHSTNGTPELWECLAPLSKKYGVLAILALAGIDEDHLLFDPAIFQPDHQHNTRTLNGLTLLAIGNDKCINSPDVQSSAACTFLWPTDLGARMQVHRQEPASWRLTPFLETGYVITASPIPSNHYDLAFQNSARPYPRTCSPHEGIENKEITQHLGSTDGPDKGGGMFRACSPMPHARAPFANCDQIFREDERNYEIKKRREGLCSNPYSATDAYHKPKRHQCVEEHQGESKLMGLSD